MGVEPIARNSGDLRLEFPHYFDVRSMLQTPDDACKYKEFSPLTVEKHKHFMKFFDWYQTSFYDLHIRRALCPDFYYIDLNAGPGAYYNYGERHPCSSIDVLSYFINDGNSVMSN